MANKKITDLTAYTTPVSADVLPIVDVSAGATKKVALANLFNILSSAFRIKDSSDTTKKVAFDVSGVATATTRTVTMPDADFTPVGTTLTQTVTNKTLSTGTKVNTSGSDTTGSIYYRDASGALVPLAPGTSGQILDISAGGLPEYIPNPAASDASTTVKGVVEKAITAEITAGTSTGGTGAQLFIGADAVGAPGASKLVQYDASGKYPAADGSAITNLASNKVTVITTPVTTSSNTETTLLTLSVPANTLGTANAIRGRLYISDVNWDLTRTFTFKFKYGSTTLVTSTFTTSNSSTTGYVGWVEFVLYGAGTTSSQKMSVLGFITSGVFSYSTSYGTAQTVGSGTSAIDSTASQTLAVTCQSSVSAGATLTMDTATIEKIF